MYSSLSPDLNQISPAPLSAMYSAASMLTQDKAIARGFDPRSVSGLQQWLDAGSFTSGVTPGAIGQLTDLSGNGNNAVQASKNPQPVNNLSTQNGYQVVHADGTDDQLVFASDIVLSDWTIVVVAKVTTPGDNVVFVGNNGVNVQAARLDDSVPQMKTYDGTADHNATVSGLTSYAVYAFQRAGGAGGTYSFFKNGTQFTTVFGGGGDPATMTVNCLWTGIDGFRASDNLAVFVFNRAVTSTEHASLVSFCRSRFQV